MIEIVNESLNISLSDITEEGSLILKEGKIIEEKQVTIYLKSKEAGCHNIPHVHVIFADNDYSIAIDGSNKLLAPKKEDKFYRYIVKTYFTSYMQKFRSFWNEKTDSIIKFKVINGTYTSSLENIKQGD